MNLLELSKQELLELQTKVEGRLKEINASKLDDIKRKNSILNKTKLSQLTSQDVILGIRFAWDHTNTAGKYLQILDAKWVVDLIDYCDVLEYTDKKHRSSGDIEFNRIRISHKTESSFGGGASITDEEADKSYLLHINTSPTGYCGFFTLSPKSWEVDIRTALDDLIYKRQSHFNIENIKLREKVELVLNNKEKIDMAINLLNEKTKS